jgi:hypothetical protein
MTYANKCSSCGAFCLREQEEPILSFSFYNPHRSRCQKWGREEKGSLIDYSTASAGRISSRHGHTTPDLAAWVAGSLHLARRHR